MEKSGGEGGGAVSILGAVKPSPPPARLSLPSSSVAACEAAAAAAAAAARAVPAGPRPPPALNSPVFPQQLQLSVSAASSRSPNGEGMLYRNHHSQYNNSHHHQQQRRRLQQQEEDVRGRRLTKDELVDASESRDHHENSAASLATPPSAGHLLGQAHSGGGAWGEVLGGNLPHPHQHQHQPHLFSFASPAATALQQQPPPPPSPPPVSLGGGQVRGGGALLSMRELVASKEKELRDIHEYRIESLEKALVDRETAMAELNARLSKLREDFRYNLSLIEGRDAELERYEETVQTLKACLAEKETEASELARHVDELLERLAEEEKRDSDAIEHWRARCKELRAEAEGLRWSHENALREAREAADTAKAHLSRQLLAAEEAADTTRRDMATSFEDLLRQREEEARRKEKDWAGRLGEAEGRAAEASHNAERVTQEAKQLKAELSRTHDDLSAAQRELRALKWQVEDSVESRSAEVKRLEQERDKIHREAEEAGKIQAERLAEVLDSMHALEKAFVKQREDAALAADGWTARESSLQAQANELRDALTQAERKEAQLAKQLRSESVTHEKALGELRLTSQETIVKKQREIDSLSIKLGVAEEEFGELRASLKNSLGELERSRLDAATSLGDVDDLKQSLSRLSNDKEALIAELKDAQKREVELKRASATLTRENEELEFRLRELESQVDGGGLLIGGGASPIFSDDMGPASPVRASLENKSPPPRKKTPEAFSPSGGESRGECASALKEEQQEFANLRGENERLRTVISEMRREVEQLKESGDDATASASLAHELEDLQSRLERAVEAADRSDAALQQARREVHSLEKNKLKLERRNRELEINLAASRNERERLLELSNSLRADLNRAVRSSEEGGPLLAEAVSLAKRETRAKYKVKIAQIETAFRSLLEENVRLKEDLKTVCSNSDEAGSGRRAAGIHHYEGGSSMSTAAERSDTAATGSDDVGATRKSTAPKSKRTGFGRVMGATSPLEGETTDSLEDSGGNLEGLGITGVAAALPKSLISAKSSDRTTESQKAAQQRLRAAAERRRSSVSSSSHVPNYNLLRGGGAGIHDASSGDDNFATPSTNIAKASRQQQQRPSITEPSSRYR